MASTNPWPGQRLARYLAFYWRLVEDSFSAMTTKVGCVATVIALIVSGVLAVTGANLHFRGGPAVGLAPLAVLWAIMILKRNADHVFALEDKSGERPGEIPIGTRVAHLEEQFAQFTAGGQSGLQKTSGAANPVSEEGTTVGENPGTEPGESPG